MELSSLQGSFWADVSVITSGDISCGGLVPGKNLQKTDGNDPPFLVGKSTITTWAKFLIANC